MRHSWRTSRMSCRGLPVHWKNADSCTLSGFAEIERTSGGGVNLAGGAHLGLYSAKPFECPSSGELRLKAILVMQPSRIAVAATR